MRTAYLVRKNTWMSAEERMVARKIGREAEKRLDTCLMGRDVVSAAVFYAAGCAAAVLGRVSARYMEMLAAGEDVTVMQTVFERAQTGALLAARAMEVLLVGRMTLEMKERDWYEETVLKGKPAAGVGAGKLDRMNMICRMDRMGAETEEEIRASVSRDQEAVRQHPGLGAVYPLVRVDLEACPVSMAGERVGSRSMALDMAAGALDDLALMAESEAVAKLAPHAADKPEQVWKGADTGVDAYAPGTRDWELTTEDTENTEEEELGRMVAVSRPQGMSGSGEFRHLCRRDRRFAERQAKRTARRGRVLFKG